METWFLTIPSGGTASRSLTFTDDGGNPYDLTDHTITLVMAADYAAAAMAWTTTVTDAVNGEFSVSVTVTLPPGAYVGTLWIVNSLGVAVVTVPAEITVQGTVPRPA